MNRDEAFTVLYGRLDEIISEIQAIEAGVLTARAIERLTELENDKRLVERQIERLSESR